MKQEVFHSLGVCFKSLKAFAFTFKEESLKQCDTRAALHKLLLPNTSLNLECTNICTNWTSKQLLVFSFGLLFHEI